MQKAQSRHASWQALLAAPPAASHIVQIYDSDEFLAAAVGSFAAQGLQAGEAVLLDGTQGHLRRIERSLRALGIDAVAAARDGQLRMSDVDEGLDAVMAGERPNPILFEAVAGEALAQGTADPRFSGVRWWGEMCSVLQQRGNPAGALAAEDLGDAAARKHGARLFCSYLYDRFDAKGYGGMLKEVCCKHTHVIPAENYVLHRLAVNRAVTEVIGDIQGPLLQSLISWKGLGCELPSSQATLFWIGEALPEHLEAVLARARAYQQDLGPAPLEAPGA